MNPNCSTITDKQIKDFIILSTTQGDTCLQDSVNGVIDELWNIAGIFTCNDKVQRYLETRLKVIQLLMSCAAKQFDTKDSFSETFQTGEGNTRSDGYAQAQASNQGFRVNDSQSCANYDDFAKAKMRSGSERDAKSCSRDTSFSSYIDQGSGRNKLTADATRASQNGVTVTNNSTSNGVTAGGSARKGCNYTVSDESGSGFGQGLPLSIPPVLASSSSYSSSFTASRWRHHMADSSSSKQTDTRTGNSHRTYGRGGMTDNRATSSSCSFYNADILSNSNGTSSSRSADDSSAFRNEDAHAEGFGQSFSKADARGEVTAQGSSKSHNDNSAKRDSHRYNRTISDSIYNSQIYKNLKEMYQITLQNLTYVNQLAIARRPPVWTDGICQIVRDGHCDIKLWMLSTAGYQASCFPVHPNPIRECCNFGQTTHSQSIRQSYSQPTEVRPGQGSLCNCG